MHKLLARQLRRCFGDAAAAPDTVRPLLELVEEAYRQSDTDRAMLERSLETVSLELADRFQRLRSALDERDESVEALSLLAATLESTTDGILVVDLAGRIVRANEKLGELWRIPQEMLARLEGERDRQEIIKLILAQLADPQAFLAKGLELDDQPDADSFDILPCLDGRVYERYSVPQRVGGVTVGRVWSFRDITHRRQLEDQLRQSQRMEAIGQLAGGIAHDFNNLLTVIRAHADFLVYDLHPASPHLEDITEIVAAADRAAQLTRQLLAFSRKQVLRPVVFDVNSVVTNLEPMLRRIIGEDISISTRPASAPAIVSADPGQMEQVVINLAVNARDAMPQGGRLAIETANVELGEHDDRPGNGITPPGRYVVLTVSDTGSGIPRDHIDRVFEPFFTTKEVGKGTGLGLSTLYGIVKQSEGYVWLDSEVGVGTTFRIYLPRASGDVLAPSEPPPAPALLGGSETILLAEDEEAVAAVIYRTLKSSGYVVLAARNGREALAMASQYEGRIDLLLTDVIMPEMGGPELVAQLRSERPGLRVLYISGYAHAEIDGEAMLQDAEFLRKPFTGRELALAVRGALGDAARTGPDRLTLT